MMFQSIIDAHIHLDVYQDNHRKQILDELEKNHVDFLISVSKNLGSAKINQTLAQVRNNVKVAYGFHPEQRLPMEEELDQLFQFIHKHHDEMVAIGEVGLPYYLRKDHPDLQHEAYIELLEYFIVKAKEYNKPVVLHAVYEDAPIVCSILEKHSVKQAHFHWFKGDSKTIERMIQNGYFISVTPDVLYEAEIQQLVQKYPLDKIMVETDGPWNFKGPFKNQRTHPKMIHQSIKEIAHIKKEDLGSVYRKVYLNTKEFFSI